MKRHSLFSAICLATIRADTAVSFFPMDLFVLRRTPAIQKRRDTE